MRRLTKTLGKNERCAGRENSATDRTELLRIRAETPRQQRRAIRLQRSGLVHRWVEAALAWKRCQEIQGIDVSTANVAIVLRRQGLGRR